MIVMDCNSAAAATAWANQSRLTRRRSGSSLGRSGGGKGAAVFWRKGYVCSDVCCSYLVHMRYVIGGVATAM